MIAALRWRGPVEISANPEWQQLAIYAVGAAIILIILFNIPFVGRIFRALFSVGMLALCLFFLFQQAPFDPTLSRIKSQLGLDDQRVTGRDVRIAMSPDGHFWARVSINGIQRRMLIDSGATISAISEKTAAEADVDKGAGLMPVILQTANGAVRAETGSIDRLTVGTIEARNLKTVISPALGPIDILGMNFLSQLASWRVEGRTLIMVPHRPDKAA
ncbi:MULTISPECIES: retropepsin-like aspartic protease family protein [Sphingobium]|jgi:aspartyl protease family protein|uniref:retropepsin-like aspartic protease family protein n=1 Tax=Sphingobium TaxID=165695 RepID=UPI000DBB3121|nr:MULTISPECIES: TIGR02281 family clan AA aspartic protease [Sphingobium]KAA9017873.1 TIGR02281 family clan AA aspartic protease [Sphingobium limneticum]BBD00001.1 aspartyl protease family protein [Sphingobium sp. YG1]